jgi:hypothetical protein
MQLTVLLNNVKKVGDVLLSRTSCSVFYVVKLRLDGSPRKVLPQILVRTWEALKYRGYRDSSHPAAGRSRDIFMLIFCK